VHVPGDEFNSPSTRLRSVNDAVGQEPQRDPRIPAEVALRGSQAALADARRKDLPFSHPLESVNPNGEYPSRDVLTTRENAVGQSPGTTGTGRPALTQSFSGKRDKDGNPIMIVVPSVAGAEVTAKPPARRAAAAPDKRVKISDKDREEINRTVTAMAGGNVDPVVVQKVITLAEKYASSPESPEYKLVTAAAARAAREIAPGGKWKDDAGYFSKKRMVPAAGFPVTQNQSSSGRASPTSNVGGVPAGGNDTGRNLPSPKTQAEYDALRPGARYLGSDGQTRTKGGA